MDRERTATHALAALLAAALSVIPPTNAAAAELTRAQALQRLSEVDT